jgi:hypothetical protein
MKIVGLRNCKNLRKYVDDIAMQNLRKGQSNYYYNRMKTCAYSLIKFKLNHEDYSLINLESKDNSDFGLLINTIMEDFSKNFLRKEKVRKIQSNLKNSRLKGSGRPGRKVDK